MLNSENAELYSGLKGGLIVIWDLQLSKVKFNLQGHSTIVTSMNLHKVDANPQILVTASGDGKLKIWDLKGKSASVNFKGHHGIISSLAIAPDCSLIASGGSDGIVKLWDIRTTKLLKEFNIVDQNTINCLEFNPHSITLAYGAKDKTIKHWDLERYSLISVTPFDRLPIEKVKFDSSGKNIFAATNETLKYWMIDDNEPVLIDMFETGWNRIQDMQQVEDETVYAVSTIGSKISYWKVSLKEKTKQTNSEVIHEFNNMGNRGNVNQVISKKHIDLNSTENILYGLQTENVFAKNGMNIICPNNFNLKQSEVIVQNNVVINNINSNINLSAISNYNNNESYLDEDALVNLDLNNRRNSENISSFLNRRDVISTSFNSIKTSEPMNIDMDNFIHKNPDETIHEISQTNDLPILQEINEQHSTLKGALGKRFRSLQMVAKWWSDSNISSTLNALNLMKDTSVINDFLNFAIISRDDINKIPLTLDHAINILPHVSTLIGSKYEAYCKTGCKVGLIMLKLLNDKITIAKGNFNTNDMLSSDRVRKCDQIIDLFYQIFRLPSLDKLCKRTKNSETCNAANALYTDLEFFLRPFKLNK